MNREEWILHKLTKHEDLLLRVCFPIEDSSKLRAKEDIMTMLVIHMWS